MPHYRIHIKLEEQQIREFTIEDPRKDIEYVYQDYKKRVNAKNGAERVTYFDLVMIAEASLFNPNAHHSNPYLKECLSRRLHPVYFTELY